MSHCLKVLVIVSFIQIATSASINRKVSFVEQIKAKNDNRYENALFGLSIEKPQDWYSMSPEALQSFVQTVAVPLAVNNNNSLIADRIEESGKSIIPMFSFLKYPAGSTNVKFNPNIIGLAAKLTEAELVQDACDYLIESKALIKGPTLMIQSSSDCNEVNINGETFARQELNILVLKSVPIQQTQYAKKGKDGYLFSFTLAYTDEIAKNEVESIMQTLKFSS